MVVANTKADRSERYRENKVISHLLDKADKLGYDLNDLWEDASKFKTEDMEEFYTLLGYSVQGFREVFGNDYCDPQKQELSLRRAFMEYSSRAIDGVLCKVDDLLKKMSVENNDYEELEDVYNDLALVIFGADRKMYHELVSHRREESDENE